MAGVTVSGGGVSGGGDDGVLVGVFGGDMTIGGGVSDNARFI